MDEDDDDEVAVEEDDEDGEEDFGQRRRIALPLDLVTVSSLEVCATPCLRR